MSHERHEPIPADFPVQPLSPDQQTRDTMHCGYCGLSWDDSICTSYTPAPAARCPFEAFHVYTPLANTTLQCPECGQVFIRPVASGTCINCGDELVAGPDVCNETGGLHSPDWSTVQVHSDGGETYVDVNCSACGNSGCVGTVKHIVEDICW